MKDVAMLAGVSLGTVSNVINSPDLVRAPTRERVEIAIAKLGWVPNQSARQLRAGRSRTLAVVVMDIANPFFTDLVLGAEDYGHEHGYFLQVSNSAQQLGAAAKPLVDSAFVDGLHVALLIGGGLMLVAAAFAFIAVRRPAVTAPAGGNALPAPGLPTTAS